MPAPPRSILILGGTREAAELAARLSGVVGLRVITSLAGRTKAPAGLAGETRVGGFGGVDGLARYLSSEGIDCVIDATHPFASTISDNAAAAAELAGIRRLILLRPEWVPEPGDRWKPVGDIDAAALALPAGARAFLALGSQHIEAFAERADCSFVVRMVDTPPSPLSLASHVLVTGRPSSDAADEESLFRQHGVTHVVCRNSGGTGASAKLDAARRLGIEIIMIRRPPAAPGPVLPSVNAVMAAIF